MREALINVNFLNYWIENIYPSFSHIMKNNIDNYMEENKNIFLNLDTLYVDEDQLLSKRLITENIELNSL